MTGYAAHLAVPVTVCRYLEVRHFLIQRGPCLIRSSTGIARAHEPENAQAS